MDQKDYADTIAAALDGAEPMDHYAVGRATGTAAKTAYAVMVKDDRFEQDEATGLWALKEE